MAAATSAETALSNLLKNMLTRDMRLVINDHLFAQALPLRPDPLARIATNQQVSTRRVQESRLVCS